MGTATDVADALEERFETYGADGFNVMPPIFPAGLEDFAELVLPELRRRGLARSDYDGPTLRDNLGLKIPIHPAASVQSSDTLAAIKKAVWRAWEAQVFTQRAALVISAEDTTAL